MRGRLAAAAAVLLVVPLTAPLVSAQGSATVAFLAPRDGSVVAGPRVDVVLAFENFRVVPAGSPVRRGAEGHAHLFIDRPPLAPNEDIPTDQPNIVHLGHPPFDARNVTLRDGSHTIYAELGDSAHRTFHHPALAKTTFTVAPGFRGRGALEPACADVARGSGEVRLVFPSRGGTAQGSIRSTCVFDTEGGACRWEADSLRRILGDYDAGGHVLAGTVTGATERRLRAGGRGRCGPSTGERLPEETFSAREDGVVVRGALGQSAFVVRPDASVDVDNGPVVPAPPERAAGGRTWWWALLGLPIAAAVPALAALRATRRAAQAAQRARLRVPAPSPQPARTCDSCGAGVRERSRFCERCGAALGAGRPSLSGTVPAGLRQAPKTNRIHREGEFWTIAYGGEIVRLRDTRGLHHLSHLLANPGREFHVLDLVAALEGTTPGPVSEDRAAEAGLRPDSSEGAEVLDAEAREAYRRRLADLDEELREAEAWNDPERAARLSEEMDALRAELAAGVGLGGRARRTASPADRARISVFRAIRGVMQRAEEAHPALGRHLSATIRTGMFCSYVPDPASPVSWTAT